jgi:hypothetical protein
MEDELSATSDQVLNRMNDLGKRIDTLENNLSSVMSHLPAEQSTNIPTLSETTK